MFKYNYFNPGNLTSKAELYQQVSEYAATLYEIKPTEILEKIQAREKLGSVQIGTNFDLPHIEYNGAKQGIILTNYKISYYSGTSLFIILNVVCPDPDLENFLKTILTDEGLDRLRNCQSMAELKKLIEGETNV